MQILIQLPKLSSDMLNLGKLKQYDAADDPSTSSVNVQRMHYSTGIFCQHVRHWREERDLAAMVLSMYKILGEAMQC